MTRKSLTDYPTQFEFVVHWGDMDAANHVNNLVYMKWTESARIHYFEKIGIDISFRSAEAGPILGWQDCKYIFPMTFPDTAVIGVKTTEILSDKFIMECAVFSKSYNRIAAISTQSIVPYSYTDSRKVDIPKHWIENIEQLDHLKSSA